MGIHTNQNGTPGHMHRQRRSAPTLKQKAAEAQAKSLHARKVPVTLKEAPWKTSSTDTAAQGSAPRLRKRLPT